MTIAARPTATTVNVVGLDILRIMRATQLPGWAPTVRLRDGLAATIDFERRRTPQ
jgi:hypothetical protein